MKELEHVASVLIREGLHVTALELNSELLRTKGRELKAIRDYFSNPSTTTKGASSAAAAATLTPFTGSGRSASSLHAPFSGSHCNSIGGGSGGGGGRKSNSNSPSLNESE